MEFAQRLSQIMEENKITKYRLAKEIGVHATTIKNWLDGKGEPRYSELQEIAISLNVPLHSLFSGAIVRKANEIPREIEVFPMDELATPHTASGASTVSNNHTRIDTALSKLNQLGQQVAVERVEELTKIPDYQKAETPADGD